jgi:hypothetical protein
MHLRRRSLRPRAIRAALPLLALATAVTGVAGAGSAFAASSASSSAAPARPDLAVVEMTVDPGEIPAAGGNVEVKIAVRNAGSGPASNVTVKVRPPAGTTRAIDYEYPPTPLGLADAEDASSWQCDYNEWRCSYVAGALAAGSDAEILNLGLHLPAGSAGDRATVSAIASTSSHETATTDNTAKVRVAYTAIADLAVSTAQSGPTDVSNLGDRTFLHVLITNVGTADAADVRVTINPPPGSRIQQETFDPFEWECDGTAAPWVCTRGALGPINHPNGMHAVLGIPVMLPAGTTGDTITLTATVSTTSPERSLANNSGEVTYRYITPEPADLQIAYVYVSPHQVVAGEQVTIGLQVENIGGSPADDVKVRVPLPDTVEPVSADQTGPDWTCSVVTDPDTGRRAWECTHPRYEPHSIEYLSPIIVTATVAAGTPDGTLSFVATVQTTSPEISTDNNTGEASTTYRAQGYISGRAWLDQDRDGQRDADEPPMGRGGDGIRQLLFMKEGQTIPPWDVASASVNPNGTYIEWEGLAPGRYFVRVNVGPELDFTTPNSGDEATDSDVVVTVRDYYGVTAESAVVEVVDGQETVVDIGLVPAQS